MRLRTSCGHDTMKGDEMHPILMQDIARYRQADMLREAEQARLARLVRAAGEERPHRRLWLRRRAVVLPTTRPAIG